MIIERKRGFYEKYLKRIIDIVCSLLAIILFSWIYIIIAVLVRVKLGSPVLFKQPRPGMINNKTGKEKIFNMYKFRTMTDEKGPDGELLSDEKRLTPFGSWLRKTSLDELPEAFNILKGDMSVIGPRPLIRDMVFMTEKKTGDILQNLDCLGLLKLKEEMRLHGKKNRMGPQIYRKGQLWRDFKLVVKPLRLLLLRLKVLLMG